STTGISAHHIGGTTINSLFGVGTGDGDINKLIKNIMFKQTYKNRIINMDILIIDEISMMSKKLFEILDTIARKIKKKPHTNRMGGLTFG
ncbi:MAG: ATP-dependent endonuclease, partial [Candidatus Lokiarchaeota archaeon]|nr:ATP-dependent endonuclease [Candidatus Lokiarchaeota archaeon]